MTCAEFYHIWGQNPAIFFIRFELWMANCKWHWFLVIEEQVNTWWSVYKHVGCDNGGVVDLYGPQERWLTGAEDISNYNQLWQKWSFFIVIAYKFVIYIYLIDHKSFEVGISGASVLEFVIHQTMYHVAYKISRPQWLTHLPLSDSGLG